MNKIAITGQIVREADLKSKGDVSLAKTAIASDRSRKGDKTDFIEIVGFNDAAGRLAERGLVVAADGDALDGDGSVFSANAKPARDAAVLVGAAANGGPGDNGRVTFHVEMHHVEDLAEQRYLVVMFPLDRALEDASPKRASSGKSLQVAALSVRERDGLLFEFANREISRAGMRR